MTSRIRSKRTRERNIQEALISLRWRSGERRKLCPGEAQKQRNRQVGSGVLTFVTEKSKDGTEVLMTSYLASLFS